MHEIKKNWGKIENWVDKQFRGKIMNKSLFLTQIDGYFKQKLIWVNFLEQLPMPRQLTLEESQALIFPYQSSNHKWQST